MGDTVVAQIPEDPKLAFGALGFALNQQYGTISSVFIDATVDMQWFDEKTKFMR